KGLANALAIYLGDINTLEPEMLARYEKIIPEVKHALSGEARSETVEILEWVALLWILALAKARSAAPISAAISAKRATQAGAKINATVDGARQKGSWRLRSVVTAHCGDAPASLLAIRRS